MTPSNKIRLGWFAFAFVAAHFIMIFLYAMPFGYVPGPLKNVAANYVHPFFEQTWNLFAPAPVLNQEMKIRYFFGADSTDWINIYQDEAELHNILRFTHHGDLVLAESNLLYYVSTDLQYMGISLYQPFPADSADAYKYRGSYEMTRTFIYGNAVRDFNKVPAAADVQCIFENVKTGEAGIIQLPRFEWKN